MERKLWGGFAPLNYWRVRQRVTVTACNSGKLVTYLTTWVRAVTLLLLSVVLARKLSSSRS